MTLLSVSHHKQQQSADCLAACAAMVMDYLALPVRYDRITKILQITEFGGVFSHLQKLESLGISILIERGELEMLNHYLDIGLPPIVPVETRWLDYWTVETYHVVVVVGVESDTVYINDPFFEAAPIAVSLNEFIPAWVEQRNLFSIFSLESLT